MPYPKYTITARFLWGRLIHVVDHHQWAIPNRQTALCQASGRIDTNYDRKDRGKLADCPICEAIVNLHEMMSNGREPKIEWVRYFKGRTKHALAGGRMDRALCGASGTPAEPGNAGLCPICALIIAQAHPTEQRKVTE